MFDSYANVSALLGKTLESVEGGFSTLIFRTTEGETYRMHHEQECCESVYIEDIVGDLNDLVGVPILMAEEVSNYPEPSVVNEDSASSVDDEDEYDWEDMGTSMWTFYKFATVKGYVTIRWYGSSNGYYSVGVNFELVQEDEDCDDDFDSDYEEDLDK